MASSLLASPFCSLRDPQRQIVNYNKYVFSVILLRKVRSIVSPDSSKGVGAPHQVPPHGDRPTGLVLKFPRKRQKVGPGMGAADCC